MNAIVQCVGSIMTVGSSELPATLTRSMIGRRATRHSDRNNGEAIDLSRVFSLNLFGRDLEDISALQSVPNLRIASLSANRVSDLSVFVHLTGLEELYLRKNLITDKRQLYHLHRLKNLRVLWVGDNPFVEKFGGSDKNKDYRHFVLSILPGLEKLDSVDVSPEERQEAQRALRRPPAAPSTRQQQQNKAAKMPDGLYKGSQSEIGTPRNQLAAGEVSGTPKALAARDRGTPQLLGEIGTPKGAQQQQQNRVADARTPKHLLDMGGFLTPKNHGEFETPKNSSLFGDFGTPKNAAPPAPSPSPDPTEIEVQLGAAAAAAGGQKKHDLRRALPHAVELKRFSSDTPQSNTVKAIRLLLRDLDARGLREIRAEVEDLSKALESR